MKKVLFIIIICIFFISVEIRSFNNYKIFEVISPDEIFLDSNQNLIYDETTPFKISNIHYIGQKDLNPSSFSFLLNIPENKKFLAEYFAKDYAKKILNNRFVKIKNNEIYINNNKYTQLLLNSKYFFDDSEESQKLFIENLKKIKTEDYVIYNNKSKKYHKLDCIRGRQSFNYRILKLSKANLSGSPCRYCFLEGKTVLYTPKISENHLITLFPNSEVYETKGIKIFFQDLNRIFKPSSKCNSKACKALKNEIDNSSQSIDFAIYGINNQPDIFNSLINAQNRGVKIRWICDFDKKNNYYQDSDKLKKYLTNFKTDEEYEKSNSSAIMHNKFFIFDNKKVWTGSSNITSTDLTEFNANYSILIDSSEIANIYSNEFNQMYNGYFHKDKKTFIPKFIKINSDTKIKTLFSPQDKIIKNEIIPLINNAKKYIYIPIFFLTHKEMEYALINAHRRGIEIKIINDATNAHTKYTIHKELRNAGIKVKTENYAGKMHMKAMIIDDYITVLGSMNYTKSAENKNDENVLIIYSQDISKFFKNTFLYLWNKIPGKYEFFDPQAESKDSIGSCFDGIDNDFDGKIDDMDEGCF